MTIYYTAKDIEEIAAQGVRQLDIGPGITLTDFARETARQLDITLVTGGQQPAAASPPAPPAVQSGSVGRSSKYNKPSGCMHGSNHTGSQAAAPAGQPAGDGNSDTVSRLIDLMGNVVKRGG